MADDCPGCRFAADVMRKAADTLASGAGSVVGGALGTQAFLRTGDPGMIARGRVAGALVAPELVERGALAVAKKVRRQSKKQKNRSKKLSAAMKSVNKKARKKNGQLKSGWSQRRILQTAHKMVRK